MPELLESADSRDRNRALTTLPDSRSDGVAQAGVAARPSIPSGPPLLWFDRVSKWYGPVIGVNQVSLELRTGITGLVGANGAGKSTLLKLATGQLRPTLGQVTVAGVDAWSPGARWQVGFCPDADRFYEEMSGRQFLTTMARMRGYTAAVSRRRTEECLELVGMEHRAERRIAGYSKGMRQRIKMAQALLHDPALLVLDEPMSGIDPIGRQEFLALFTRLAANGKCLLVSSHELDELEKLTDHVAVMARGRIAAVGTLAQIRDLLDDRPLSILVESDQIRKLAAALMALPDVAGVDLGSESRLVVRARNPKQFFHDFAGLVLEENYDVRRLETLDGSAGAILSYLLGGPSL